ncbi:MAG TPA: HlyC/CorC family transporter [Lachnospiraceae bacterium]|nr:HlyC/CorC family transporter [Lachnospiraceae bacterium]
MAKGKKLFKLLKKSDNISEELIEVVNESHEKGVINTNEADMIQNIVEFRNKDAKDVMIHRKNVVALDGKITVKEAIEFVNENSFSRYPVYLDDIDDIIGSVHIKQLLKYVNDSKNLNKRLQDIDGLIREIGFIPETNAIYTVFNRMKIKKNHIAIVVDEYGQTSGIITMEDILEEIVGNIFDENDTEKNSIVELKEGEYRIEGVTSIEDVEALLGIKIEGEFETLNGFLTYMNGKIPSDNSTFLVRAYGYKFQVIDVKNKVIQDVKVSKLDKNSDK